MDFGSKCAARRQVKTHTTTTPPHTPHHLLRGVQALVAVRLGRVGAPLQRLVHVPVSVRVRERSVAALGVAPALGGILAGLLARAGALVLEAVALARGLEDLCVCVSSPTKSSFGNPFSAYRML